MATAKITELDESNTCKICENALALYSCPKCNIIYCSLECYRSVSHLECSEQFYKENILEELKLNKEQNDKQFKMFEILQKTHENNKVSDDIEEYDVYPNLDLDECDIDSDDDVDCGDISERLAGVNLDDAEQIWEKLTEDEKQDFVAFLKSEDISKLIPSWEPWWTYFNDDKIEDLSNKEKFKDKCPIICDIKDFNELTTKKPSDYVQYNLINILAAYVFTMKYFNGECYDFAKESVSCIVSLSLTLKDAQNFQNFETAVKSVEQESINSDWILTDTENIQIMREDLERLLKGPKPTEKNFYVLCALSDVKFLLNKASISSRENSADFSKKFPDEHFPIVKLESPNKIKNLTKKIEYFLSYAKYHYNKE